MWAGWHRESSNSDERGLRLLGGEIWQMACVPGHDKRKSEPWVCHQGGSAVLIHFLETSVRPLSTLAEQAHRSQGGPMSVVPFTSFPTSAISRFKSSVFRVLLQRRLWLPLPPSTRKCRCGRLLDVRGHHRAACVGEAWFPSGVSSCTSLPRGRGASVHPMSW